MLTPKGVIAIAIFLLFAILLTCLYIKMQAETGKERKYGKRFYRFTQLFVVIFPVYMLISFLNISGTLWVFRWHAGVIVSILWILYYIYDFLSSVVGPKELGGMYAFGGTPTCNANPAPWPTAFGVFELQKTSQTIINLEVPDNPENIFTGSDDEDLPDGKSRPIRITTATVKLADYSFLNSKIIEQYKDELLHLQGTITVAGSIILRPDDFLTYNASIQDERDLKFIVASLFRGKMNELLPGLTLAMIIRSFPYINAAVKNAFEDMVEHGSGDIKGKMGLTIIGAPTVMVNIPKRISIALAELAKAGIMRNAMVVEAKGIKEKTIIEARGLKEHLALEGKGAALALGELLRAAKEHGVDPTLIAQLQTAMAAFEKANYTYLLGGEGLKKELFALAPAVSEAILKMKQSGG